ncbi:hypothetical protein EGH26_09315 [Halomicroarcula pellucida]|uniref:Uncharacterized protein n=1 Tax=Haloarcula pellucida TaxID=1427151 RepID=A0A830GJR6_9EURY|nr:hypothetical protein [Halomicroarcula pellucida]MBX0348401.1 hypothetical protein [Halomicroarcula pellucida]GGN93546.1 hypothetical protein GCM10009030_19070 [Halomicroarcula pellucida]
MISGTGVRSLLLQTGIGPIDAIIGLFVSIVLGIVNFAAQVLPTVLLALLVLGVGYVVADRLDTFVFEWALENDVDGKAGDTPASAVVADEDGVATAAGQLVRYLVLVVAVVAAIRVLNLSELQELLDIVIGYVPNVVAAAVLLVVGFGVGRIVRSLVPGLVDRTALGDSFPTTHFGRVVDADGGTVGRLAGIAVEYYVYLVTLYVVAATLAIGSVAGVLGAAVSYVPTLLGALVLLLLGAIVADYVGTVVRGVDEVADSPFESLVTGGVQAVVYLFTVVIALDVAGVDATLLGLLLLAVVLPVGLAFALAFGLSVGYGGQDYVEQYLGTDEAAE